MTQKSSLVLILVTGVTIAGLVLPRSAFAYDHEKVIYSLTDDYSGPTAKLLYAGGNFYGTTGGGNVTQACPGGCGTVFEFSQEEGHDWTYQVLYEFRGGKTDGASPVGNIVMDSAGNIYGATTHGGVSDSCIDGCGTIFELTPGPNGQWSESIIRFFSFNGGTVPVAGLALDASDNLYGTTTSGGNGYGSVYELVPHAGGDWVYKVLYFFGPPPDGGNSRAEVTLDAGGNIYGTTSQGGSSLEGTVFQLIHNAESGWTENVIYDFTPATGCIPVAQPWIDPSGNLYGTASECGEYEGGVVYKLAPSSGNSWTESTVHSFGNGLDGNDPRSPLTPDVKGNLWGTTLFGGATNGGTVYKLKSGSEGTWTENVIYSVQMWGTCPFPPVCYPPTTIFSGLTFGSGSNVYGTAYGGGNYGQGAIYEILQ